LGGAAVGEIAGDACIAVGAGEIAGAASAVVDFSFLKHDPEKGDAVFRKKIMLNQKAEARLRLNRIPARRVDRVAFCIATPVALQVNAM